MRIFIGNLCILLFIGLFVYFFLGANQEYKKADSLHDVLDDKVTFDNLALPENSVILDVNNNPIYDIYSEVNRIYLSFDNIPQPVIDALLAAEDQGFFDHQGFDMKGIVRAFFINSNNGAIQQGGSTVTQQLVRNLYLTSDKTYERKVTELLYAYQLERQLSKEKIIELYINAIYFQNGVYGIEAASQFYFSKPAEKLTVAEVAFLSAIPNHPQLFNPLTNIEHTHKRKVWILTKMYELDKINEATFIDAKKEKIHLNISKKNDHFPDYVTYVYHEFEQLISDKEGYTKKWKNAQTVVEKNEVSGQLKERVQTLLSQGITIKTALDPVVQEQAVQSMNHQLTQSKLQGAVTIIDHTKSEIVAITGGVNYKKFDFHRGFQAFRQPGSAIKPLLVFAPYIEENFSTEMTIIDASPFSKNGYQPTNYGGALYGKVRMEQALKHSYNTAAVRMLDQISPTTAFTYFNSFDFQGIETKDMGLPAALGGLTNGVSVLEITQAYSTFATNGIYYSPKAIRHIKAKDGHDLFSRETKGKEIWSNDTNEEMRKMLERVVKEGTGKQAYFETDGFIGGKTGTTNSFHDLWFVGSSENYTAGIWLGMDRPEPISKASSQHLHLQTWRDIMSKIEKN